MRRRFQGVKRLRRRMTWVVPGALALGTSCLGDVRKSLVAAGLDFVQDSAGIVLDAAFPIDEILSNP